jgi:hypothetical protein
MNISGYPRFAVLGFSGKRVGLILSCISLGLIPFHFYVSCQASQALAESSFVIFCAAGVLSFICRRGTPHRFRAVALSFIALVGHTLCSH